MAAPAKGGANGLLTALWLPILLSAVAVFIASSILHMVLTYHRSDYSAMPGEDNVLEAMRKEGAGRGRYSLATASILTRTLARDRYQLAAMLVGITISKQNPSAADLPTVRLISASAHLKEDEAE